MGVTETKADAEALDEGGLQQQAEEQARKSALNGSSFNAAMDVGADSALKNNPTIRKRVNELRRTVDDAQRSKAAIQAEINEAYSTVAAEGIPKDAFKRARNDAELTREQLAQRDYAFLICRQAMGIPLEFDLFMSRAEIKKFGERLKAKLDEAAN